MPMIKPPFNGKDATSGFYDGPPPVPGTYHGVVSRMGLATVLSGENEGADKIVVVVKITSGKYNGAEIFSNFTLLTQSAWSLNQFLEAMTDGSEKQRKIIRDWFWDIGYSVESEAKNEKLGRQFEYIGKPAFKPIGKKVAFVTEMNGERANIAKFVIPLEDSDGDVPSDEVAELPDVATEDIAVEPEKPKAKPKPEPEPESEPEAIAVAEDDDDDPWS